MSPSFEILHMKRIWNLLDDIGENPKKNFCFFKYDKLFCVNILVYSLVASLATSMWELVFVYEKFVFQTYKIGVHMMFWKY